MINPKYKGIKVSINDNNMRISLKKNGKSFCKTFFYVNEDIKFENRKDLLNYLNDYLEKILIK